MQFFETVMGKRFFEHQLPTLIKSVNRLAEAIENSNQTSSVKEEPYNPLLAFIKQEVPFRLKEVIGVPENECSNELIEACIDRLYSDNDIMFDYDKIDAELSEIYDEFKENEKGVEKDEE